MFYELIKIAFEGIFSNACYDTGKNVFSDIINRTKLKRFYEDIEEWEYEFEKKHDGTVVTNSDFHEYVQNNKVFEQIIKYVLSDNITDTKRHLDGNDFINTQISNTCLYLIEKKVKLTPIDNGIIKTFYNQVFEKIKTFLFEELANSESIEQKFILNKILASLEIIIEQRQNDASDNTNLQKNYVLLLEQLQESFEDEKQNNPSFALVEFDQTIVPSNKLIDNNTVTLDNSSYSATFSEFLSLSKENKKTHIFLYGMGGIGKTVTLLSTQYNNPVIYIPLRNVNKNDNCISDYIKEQTLHSDENIYKTLIQYCERNWNKKTQLSLIIDGLNEIDLTLRRKVIQEIDNVWSKKRNIQLIVTSRNDMSNELNNLPMLILRTNPLSREAINDYLNSNNIPSPMPSSNLWYVIDTPLMLTLYVKSNYLKDKVKSSEIVLRQNKNSGSIIWNFLQSEIYRLKQSNYSNYFAGIIAAIFIAPFIAYKMQENGDYFIKPSVFSQYINQGYNLYQKYNKLGLLPKYLNSLIEDEEGGEEIEKSTLNYILSNKLYLFHKTDTRVQLVHQHFRDCFAAIHIIHMSEIVDDVPEEWKNTFSPNVTEFVADLISTEDVFNFDINTWKKIWEYDYKYSDPSPCFIPQMLQIYKLCFGPDLSKVNFSNLDLSEVSLTGYKFSAESKNNFINTKLSNKTFIGNGHRKSITSVSWSPSNKNFFSASHDCTVRMWDDETKQEKVIRDINHFHKHYIRCGQWNPTEENSFITSGDDKHIVIWEKADENIGWVTKSIGECSDWVVGIEWSNDGKQILCGERNGNIELFNKKGKVSEYKKIHTDYVRRIAWSKDNAFFATGSDDGLVCIWNANENSPIKILKLRKNKLQSVTSIKWLCEDKVLAISDEATLYLFDFEKILALDEQEVFCESKDFLLNSRSSNKISFVAITTKNSDNYYSVFHETGIDIFRGRLTAQNTYEFSTIATKSTKSQDFNKIICADWNNDCDRIVCGSRDGNLCEIKVDVSEEHSDRISLYTIGYKNNNAVRCAKWSHNNKFVVAGYDDCRVRIWDLEHEKCINVLEEHKDSVKCVVWSPDDDFVASGSDDCTINIWNPFKNEPYKKAIHHSGAVNSILWLKSGHIISASDDKSIVKFNTKTEKKTPVPPKHTKRIYCLASSPDEKHIISVGNDKLLCLWDIENCECLQSIDSEHSEPIRSVAWSSNGIVVTGSNDCSWILRTIDNSNMLAKEYIKKDNAHKDFIYSIAISNDNKYVITGSTDYTVGFWNIENQELICYGDDHDFFIWSVSPSADPEKASYVSTSSSDGTLKIWNTSELINGEIHPEISFEVIANINIVGCDFSEAVFETEELKKLIETNGGLV